MNHLCVRYCLKDKKIQFFMNDVRTNPSWIREFKIYFEIKSCQCLKHGIWVQVWYFLKISFIKLMQFYGPYRTRAKRFMIYHTIKEPWVERKHRVRRAIADYVSRGRACIEIAYLHRSFKLMDKLVY